MELMMKNRFKGRILLIAVLYMAGLALLPLNNADAREDADFVFHIPVEVEDLMPEVRSIEVIVQVYRSEDEIMSNAYVGRAFKQVELRNGSYEGTVELNVTLDENYTVHDVQHYFVSLVLEVGMNAEIPSPDHELAACRPAPGTEFLQQYMGQIQVNP